tara:strand:+ start:2419 stop:3237 length:819 start_codon:yes stop_codon:yes gene_type:complete
VGQLVVIKLGGGLITEKAEMCTAKPFVIENLAECIYKLSEHGFRIIIVHGAGSFGHLKAKKWKLNEGFIEGFIPNDINDINNQHMAVESVRNDMMILNHKVVMALESFGISAKSHPPHQWVTGIGREFTGDISKLEYFDGTVAVTFGDVVECDDGSMFGILSGDDICYRLAHEMNASHMIFAMGGAPGLMSSPPDNDDSELIPIWSNEMEFDGEHMSNIDVTGGIYLKLESANLISKSVPNVWIVDGEHPSRIEQVVLTGNTIGTKIIHNTN